MQNPQGNTGDKAAAVNTRVDKEIKKLEKHHSTQDLRHRGHSEASARYRVVPEIGEYGTLLLE